MIGRLLVLLLSLGLAPGVAQAHAVLVESQPVDGASLDRAPATFALRFNEPVRAVALRLVDGQGRDRLGGTPATSASEALALPVPLGLPDGSYWLSYRVVSADGHPVAGSIGFAIGAASGVEIAPVAAGAQDGLWRIAAALNRAATYGGILMAAGGALFLLVVAPGLPGDFRRAVRLPLWSGIAGLSLLVSVPLQGAALADGVPADLLGAAAWALGASTSVGDAAAIGLAGLAALVLAARVAAARSRVLLVVGAALTVAALGVTGHAATAAPRWLTTPAVIVHGLVAAFWIGSLPGLLRALRGTPVPVLAGLMQRFSRTALVAVAALALSGLALAAVQVETPAALLATGYGRLLLAKLLGVVALLGLAALNKWRLTPALAVRRLRRAAADRLARSIRAELAVAALVILVTAWLGTTPPPRAAALADHAAHAHAHAGTGEGYLVAAAGARDTVFVELQPGRAGRNRLRILLRGGDPRQILTAQEVTVSLSLPAAGIEPLQRPARREADGSFLLEGADLSLPGDWILGIEALVGDFDRRAFELELPIR